MPKCSGCRRIGHARRAVEDVDRDFAPAVRHVEQQPPVAFRRVDRLQQVEVGGELDVACGVLRRELDVGDLPVQRVRGIGGEAQRADDFFVGAGIAERFAAEDDFALLISNPVTMRSSRLSHRDGSRFRPTMPMTMSARQTMRAGDAGSPKTIIPNRTVPTAPIPVHTA